jgi:hypothetical protein
LIADFGTALTKKNLLVVSANINYSRHIEFHTIPNVNTDSGDSGDGDGDVCGKIAVVVLDG